MVGGRGVGDNGVVVVTVLTLGDFMCVEGVNTMA